MPLYEYRCDTCDKTFEVLKKMGDPALVNCPRCDGEADKVMSGFAIGGAEPAGSVPACATGGGCCCG